MLAAIGLDETHEAAYRALVSVGAADIPDLARRLGLGEPDTERALRRLERHGLAAQSSSRPGRWVAAPPGVALGALLTQHRHELEKAELTAALLAEEYRARAAEPTVHDLVEVVTGAAAVAQRFLQLQLGATEEVQALVTGAPMAVTAAENHAEEQAAARGVRYRVVVERAVLDGPAAVGELSAALGREERVRVAERVPTKLVVADRTLAMVPLVSSPTPNRRRWSCTPVVCWRCCRGCSRRCGGRRCRCASAGTARCGSSSRRAPTARTWRSCPCSSRALPTRAWPSSSNWACARCSAGCGT